MKAVQKTSAKGFTIAEVLVATLIVGMCLAAGMVAIGSSTQLTSDSLLYTKATLLAQEVREWSLNVDYEDITTMELTDAVPRDSLGSALSGYSGWTETIAVDYLSPTDITTTSATATDVAKVAVTIKFSGDTVLTTSWLVVEDQP